MWLPEHGGHAGFDVVSRRFDAASEVCLRSSLSSFHDVITATPFDHTVHHCGF